MSTALDLTGKRFGILTAIERAPEKNGKTMWRCKCDCGNEVIRQTASLLNSKETGNCGCKRKKKDLTGMVFGELTVLRFGGYYKKNPKWICKCSCGEEVSVFENGLKAGFTVNCRGVVHEKCIGKKYGRLTVLPEIIYDGKFKNRKYLCKCDCGNYTYSTLGNLTSGNTKSCGCLERELIEKRINNRENKISIVHGMKNTRIYGIWSKMRSRCNNPNNQKYYRYGGRGISVCSEWNDFLTFYEWAMSHGYSDLLCIDRIDNDGNYSPDNCRCTTNKVQANNKSTNARIEYKGEIKTLAQWCEEYNVCKETVRRRYSVLGWSFDRCLNTPTGLKERKLIGEIEIEGEKHTVPEWAKIKNINPQIIYNRLRKGWNTYDAIMRPPENIKKEG